MKIRRIALSAVSVLAAALMFCACSGIRNGSGGGGNASSGMDSHTAKQGAVIDLSSSDGILNISSAGSYTLTGSLDGYVKVDTDGDVTLTLSGAEIRSAEAPAILVSSADKVTVLLAEGTDNVLWSGEECNLTGDDGKADGALFSRADLVINGEGSLSVTSEYKHGIVSKDSLTIDGGSITVDSVKTGIEGKDSVLIRGGDLTVNGGTDGIKSTNDTDAGRGTVTVDGGKISVASGDDGIYAVNDLTINGGTVDVMAGVGVSDGAKGLNCDGTITVNGGEISVDAEDDAIHGVGDVLVNGGSLTLKSRDDGVHSDADVTVAGGTLAVTRSYEGIEAVNVSVSGGEITLVSSDDGINVTDGTDGETHPMGGASACTIDVSGGFIYVNAGGDGIDSNGSFTVSDGTVLVSGPTDNGNGALDYQSNGTVTGGVVMAVGSQGMAMGFDGASAQPTLVTNVSGGTAGSRVTVCDGDGEVICSFVAEKEFANVVLTAPELKIGDKYTVFIGGECDGESGTAGFVRGGKLTGGTAAAEVTLTESMGQSGQFTPGGAGPGGPGGPGGGGMAPPDQRGGQLQIPGGING